MHDAMLYLGGVVLVLGAAFSLLGSIGVVRLPDLYTRLHAASKAGVVGGGLILVAVAIVSLDAAITTRAIIGVLFLVLTTPLSAHLLARASYITGYEVCTITVQDDIKFTPKSNTNT